MRYRFDLALRNFLNDPSESQVSAQKPVSDVAPQQGELSSSKLRRLARTILSPLARRLKRYFVGDILLALEGMRTKLDFQIVSMHHKLDDLHIVHQRITNVQNDLTNLQNELSAVHQLANKGEQQRAILGQRLDDVSLHVRSPVRVDPSTYAVRTGDGFVFVPDQDIQLLLLLIDAGVGGLEPGTRAVIQRLLQPGMTFVDVGAHIGLLTLAAARAVGPSGRVIALEPTELTFSLLKRGLEINGIQNFTYAHRVGAGATRGRTVFYLHPVLGHNSAYLSDGASSVVEVELVPLDEIIAPGERVDLIKIDVEGAELEVLKGMHRILNENQNVALVVEFGPSHLNRTGLSPADWFAAFESAGFSAQMINELSGELTPIIGGDYPKQASVNILFQRR